MKIKVPETEDPTFFRLPLITSGLYIFYAYLRKMSHTKSIPSNR